MFCISLFANFKYLTVEYSICQSSDKVDRINLVDKVDKNIGFRKKSQLQFYFKTISMIMILYNYITRMKYSASSKNKIKTCNINNGTLY